MIQIKYKIRLEVRFDPIRDPKSHWITFEKLGPGCDPILLTDLVEEEVVDVVGEEGAQLALLGLAGAHVHLYLLDEAAEKGNTRSTSAPDTKPYCCYGEVTLSYW